MAGKNRRAEVPTTWVLYECEQGRRWSEVKTASYYEAVNPSLTPDGSVCQFSGCQQDHKVKALNEVRAVPPSWFQGWEPWESSPRYKALAEAR